MNISFTMPFIYLFDSVNIFWGVQNNAPNFKNKMLAQNSNISFVFVKTVLFLVAMQKRLLFFLNNLIYLTYYFNVKQ